MKLDTIYCDTLLIHDTLIKFIDTNSLKSSASNDHYKDLLSSQSTTYNFIIYVFLAILALFSWATWLYNKKLVKDEIIKETDKVFQQEKNQLINKFKEEFNDELNMIRGENARAFAIAIKGNNINDFTNRLYWWIKAAEYYNMADKGKGVRICLDLAIQNAKKCLVEKEKSSSYISKHYSNVDFLKMVTQFPDTLDKEKKELDELLKDLLE